MITQIRNIVQSAHMLKKIFIAVVVLSLMGVFSLPLLLTKKNSTDWAIRVNNTYITHETVRRRTHEQQEWYNRLKGYYGSFADIILQSQGISTDATTRAREVLVNEALLHDFAEQNNLTISRSYVIEKMQDKEFAMRYLSSIIPPFIFDAQGILDRQLLSRYLQHQGMTINSLIDQIVACLQRQMIVDCIGLGVYVPTFDTSLQYASAHAVKQCTVITFAFDDSMRTEQDRAISKEELSAFFNLQNSQSQRYVVPETRTVTTWHFDLKQYVPTIDKEQVERYYQDHKDRLYTQKAAQVKVRQIVYHDNSTKDRPSLTDLREQLLKNPNSFATYAKQYSDDEASKSKGGLVAPITRSKDKSSDFEKAAFILVNKGDISSIVPVDGGMALLQLVKKTPRTYTPFSTVEQDIKNIVARQAFKQQFNTDMQRLMSEQPYGNDTLTVDAALNNMGLVATKKYQDCITYDGSQKAKAAFSIDKVMGMTFYVTDHEAFLMQLDTITPKYIPTLEQVQEQVLHDLHHAAAHKNLMRIATKARDTLTPTSDNKAADGIGSSTIRVVTIDPQQEKAFKEWEKQGFTLPLYTQLEKVGQSVIFQKENDVILVRLDAIHPVDTTESSDKKNELQQQSERSSAEQALKLFIDFLRKKATIEISESWALQSEDISL